MDAATIAGIALPKGHRVFPEVGDWREVILPTSKWRICFRFEDGDAFDLEICDSHQVHRTMAIRNTGMKRRPTHPGEMLREDFLPDYGLSVSALAEAIGVSRQSVNELLRERRSLSPEMALRLSRLFGNTPEFWLNAQRAVDLWEAGEALKDDVARIRPLDDA